uniref:Uncharacterized protein n=1 Tax=Arundo donax TaxID=35708 RepID=A0A0A9BI60_ARUDO
MIQILWSISGDCTRWSGGLQVTTASVDLNPSGLSCLATPEIVGPT